MAISWNSFLHRVVALCVVVFSCLMIVNMFYLSICMDVRRWCLVVFKFFLFMLLYFPANVTAQPSEFSDSSSVCSGVVSVVEDVDGNIYNVVEIGEQKWMKENLCVSRYNDGVQIAVFSDSLNNFRGRYCAEKVVFYDWDAVHTGKLCPLGWHVPSDEEWSKMETYLGGMNVAGGKLKECGHRNWQEPNVDASDLYAFSAIATGFWEEDRVKGLKEGSIWWTSSPYNGNPSFAWVRSIYNSGAIIYKVSAPKKLGFAVRCIKNANE